jgi:hypothetical protein
MTANINTNFIVPSPFELRKSVRELNPLIGFRAKLMETTSNSKEFEDTRQIHIGNKERHENELKTLQDEIESFKRQIVFWEKKILNAKRWMEKPDRDIQKDEKCLNFQKKATDLIEELKTVHIPHIENIIVKRNYKGAIEFNEKYIRNTPLQVIQRLQGYNDSYLTNFEKRVVDFYSVKGKEAQIQVLRSRLTKGYGFEPTFETKFNFKLSLEQRIQNLESAIAFNKLAKSRPNGQVLKKQADEYFHNELLEIEMMCKEEWFAYLNRIYFKGGMSTFYK